MNVFPVILLALLALFPDSCLAQSVGGIPDIVPKGDFGWPHLLGMAGIGLILGPVSKAIKNFFMKRVGGWRDSALELDNKVSDFTEKKWGFRLPATIGDLNDAMIKTFFHGTEELAKRPDLIRNVIRAAVALSPARGFAVMAELANVTDFNTYFYDQLSDETRELFNLEKKAVATKMINSSIKANKAVTVEAFVDAAAAADKSYKIENTPVATPEVVAQIVQEERAKVQYIGKPVEAPTNYAARLDAILAAGGDPEDLMKEIEERFRLARLARQTK